MWRFLRNLLLVIALVIGVAFGFFNQHLVTIDVLWSNAQAPLILILLIAFVVGFGLALVLLLTRLIALRGGLARTRSQLKDARTEIRNLRSLPIHDA